MKAPIIEAHVRRLKRVDALKAYRTALLTALGLCPGGYQGAMEDRNAFCPAVEETIERLNAEIAKEDT